MRSLRDASVKYRAGEITPSLLNPELWFTVRAGPRPHKSMARIIELKIPDIGGNDGIEVVRWNKQPGESFTAGDELCELVTDKAAFSLEAPKDGKLLEICIKEKAHPKIGDLAARIEVAD
jgi:hypothetical protein